MWQVPFFQPKDHKMIKPGAFQAEEKELVFDIDMTDYDEVRTCCKWVIFLIVKLDKTVLSPCIVDTLVSLKVMNI